VEVFKDGVSFGIFENARIIEDISMEIFGVRLSRSKISSVCNKNRKHHKGYTFKHVITTKEEL